MKRWSILALFIGSLLLFGCGSDIEESRKLFMESIHDPAKAISSFIGIGVIAMIAFQWWVYDELEDVPKSIYNGLRVTGTVHLIMSPIIGMTTENTEFGIALGFASLIALLVPTYLLHEKRFFRGKSDVVVKDGFECPECGSRITVHTTVTEVVKNETTVSEGTAAEDAT